MSTAPTDFLSPRVETQVDASGEARSRSQASVLGRLLLGAVIFFATGEAMLRFDARTLFFTSQTRLSNDAKQTPELAAATTGDLAPFEHSFRIAVIGDSYLYGAGVAADRTFAARVRNYFQEHPMNGFSGAAVLDLTRPGANTYMNVAGFYEYAPRFRPHVVILAYNANDVYGRQSESSAVRKVAPSSDGAALESTRSLRRILFSSKLVEFLLTKINMELKHAGVIVPGTEFEHQIRRSHDARYTGWIASQEHLRKLSDYCREHGIFLEVANMPDLSMLDNYSLYRDVDRALDGFFPSAGIRYTNAAEAFLPPRGEKYAISRYDGHPNEHAHQIIADYLIPRIAKGYSTASPPAATP